MPLPYSACTDEKILGHYYRAKLSKRFPFLPERVTGALANYCCRAARHKGGSKALILPYLELCITPRCTLSCTHCANFMQRYERPVSDYTLAEIVPPLHRFMQAVDYIAVFKILGGEPFLHKNLAEILAYCASHHKIGRIIVTTNGSIQPSTEVVNALRQAGAHVCISNYPITDQSRKNLAKILTAQGVFVKCEKEQEWVDFGDGQRFSYSEEAVRDVMQTCWVRCKTLVKNEFHICPRSAHGTALGFIEKRPQDYLDIEKLSISALRKRIQHLYDVPFVAACYHCTPVAEARRIPAGEQMRRIDALHIQQFAGKHDGI